MAFSTLLLMVITKNDPRDEHLDRTLLARECNCTYENVDYNFCYRLPANASVKGLPFDCEHAKYLDRLDLLDSKNAIDLKFKGLPEPVFVTAFSGNHYKEGLTLIANFRKLWRKRKLFVYDLGLDESSVNELKGLCLVEVRRFKFEHYPSHVRNLKEYRWKPLIIAEALKEFGAVWYMDSSIRWKKDKLDIVYNEFKCRKYRMWNISINFYAAPATDCKKSGYVLFVFAGHGVYSTTHPGMYRFIPTDIEQLKNKSENYAASVAFVVRTEETLELMKWHVLCALEKYCMAPPRAHLYCTFRSDKFGQYANCHRYDQSAINLLLANGNEYNVENYVTKLGEDGVIIDRAEDNRLLASDFLCNDVESS